MERQNLILADYLGSKMVIDSWLLHLIHGYSPSVMMNCHECNFRRNQEGILPTIACGTGDSLDEIGKCSVSDIIYTVYIYMPTMRDSASLSIHTQIQK